MGHKIITRKQASKANLKMTAVRQDRT